MENEIKVNEYVRLKDGTIAKVIEIKNQNTDIFNWYCLDNDMGTMDRSIVKHSSNIIDLIQCGDYVNGKEVIMDLEKSKEWYKSKDNFITCKDYTFEEDEIKTIVTKEMMESISYKVTKM